MSAYSGGNYYLYSFDGKLLQMYDVHGVLLKDYLYLGDRLVAEYDPLLGQNHFRYYTPDQIGSTRVVTDQDGYVVHSAAYDPYGGVQKTWEPSFDPLPKFSGKEHDEESGLDYFGARYYDRSICRFISTDPVGSPRVVSIGPQSLSLYAFAKNNPVSYVDVMGAYPVLITITRTRVSRGGGIMGNFLVETPTGSLAGNTLERPYGGIISAMTSDTKSCVAAGSYTGVLTVGITTTGQTYDTIMLISGENLGTRTEILFHNGASIDDTTGCILVGYNQDSSTGALPSPARQDIINLINAATAEASPMVLDVLGEFSSLLSIADFPEITVNISWGPSLIAQLQKIGRMVSYAF